MICPLGILCAGLCLLPKIPRLPMLPRVLISVQHLPLRSKAFSLVIAFLTPLADLIHLVVALLLIDAFTSIYYQMSKAAEKAGPGKKWWAALMVIESARLRRTLEKMFFYVLTLIVFYAFELLVLQLAPAEPERLQLFSMTNIAAALIGMVELTSIASNVSRITGNPIFNRIARIFGIKVNQQLDLHENNTQHRPDN